MNESKRWHVTHAATEKSPMVWKLEGNQAIAFGFSIGLALLLFQILVSAFAWSMKTSVVVSSALPVITLFVILSLVRDKPKGHLVRWVEWQVLRIRSEELMTERANHLKTMAGKGAHLFHREKPSNERKG